MSRSPDPAGERDLLERLAGLPELFTALTEATGTELQVQSRLRDRFAPELVRMAMEVAEQRRRAAGKFARADRIWCTRQGLEQASAEAVARHKARRFAAAGGAAVWDLCCGIGGDALALAAGCDVTAVDLDPAQCLRTELNAAVYDVSSRVTTQTADVKTLDVGDRLVHLDPDRRVHGTRTLRLEQYAPPLDWMQSLASRRPGGAIKVSPASNFGGKFPDAEIELISLHGECKEATVWFGDLRGEAPWRATLLPEGYTLAGHPLDAPTDVRPLGRYLYDPNPAIVRAGLVDLLARDYRLWRLDAAEEYLSSDDLIAVPGSVPFEVEEVLPNNPREIRAAIRRRAWGSAEIKCRHVPTDADVLRRRLPLEGDQPGVLFIARLGGRTQAILARRQISDCAKVPPATQTVP